MKPVDQKHSLFLVEFSVGLSSRVFHRKLEPLFEVFARGKNRRQKEVEERPELREIVLQGSSREKESAVRFVVRSQSLCELRVLVLQFVSFVNYNVFPVEFAQLVFLFKHVFVSGYANVEFLLSEFQRLELSLLRISFVNQRLD